MSAAERILRAAENGEVNEITNVLRENPGAVHARDQHLKTPLHFAAERDHAAVVEALLNAGADIEAKTSWGATPLDWAATNGSDGAASALLAHGAQGMNLVAAAGLGRQHAVLKLLESGVPGPSMARRGAPIEPNEDWVAHSAYLKGDILSDAFYAACRNGHTEVASLLLDRGADINALGVFGGTGLHWAAINGHSDMVAFLIAHGADLTIRDVKFDSTAEGWAVEGQQVVIRDMLRNARR